MADAAYDTLRNRLILGAIIGSVRALGPLRRPLAGLAGLAWYAGQPATVRHRAADNHRRLEPGLSAAQAQGRARASYFQYLAMILDGVRVERLSDAQLREAVDIEGAENVAGGNGIMVTSHFGNWDIGMSTAHALGLPMTTVMAAIGSTTVTSLVELSRHRKDFELFTPRQAARGLLRALRRGRWVGLMLDVPEAGPTVVVPFCGGMVRVSSVPARLAAATSIPIVPA
ncbi:MAG: lysophospholipid acyltransferase family protein, partial [Candidatus Dormibacteraeota bacterium]|nr:lysophospholipid acyltransferase family protein [Candidatus Dormibacteraeota bacterium]